MSYRVLVLPQRETMTPSLLRKIKELVAAGATVVGPPPRQSPGLSGYPGCDAEVRRLADELWGDGDGQRGRDRAFGKGRVVWECSTRAVPSPAATQRTAVAPMESAATTRDVGAPPLSKPEQYGDFAVAAGVLERMGVPQDFESDIGLRHTHRRDGGTDIYFVANPENRSQSATCTFRVHGKQPELWDAVSGDIRDLPEFTMKGGRTTVPLDFEPLQSFFIVFRKPAVGTKISSPNFTPLEISTELSGPWEVSFDPAWGGPDEVTFAGLEDWSRRPEPGIRYYSGLATYRKTFDLTVPLVVKSRSGASPRLWLDLGTVKNIARVRLNGQDIGVVWCAPWRVDVTGRIEPKGNCLKIEVANLWPNRLIGDEQLPADCEYGRGGNLARWPDWFLRGEPRPSRGRYTFTTWKHFNKDSPLLPSGLLGPVRFLRQAR